MIKHQAMMVFLKEFYETFLDNLKYVFLNSLNQTKERHHFSVLRGQAIMKLLEKKDRDKRYIKNWRPVFSLNVCIKIVSESLVKKLRETLLFNIFQNQAANVKNRCNSECY